MECCRACRNRNVSLITIGRPNNPYEDPSNHAYLYPQIGFQSRPFQSRPLQRWQVSGNERQSDSVLDELKRFVEEESRVSREWRGKHDREALEFRREILSKIRPFEEFSSGLSILWKILLGVSALIMSVVKLWDWIRDHVR